MSEPTGDMRVLIEQIAKALVDEPAQVAVNQVEEVQSPCSSLRLRRMIWAKVIGKQGRTARAMRTCWAAAGLKFNKRFTLEILE